MTKTSLNKKTKKELLEIAKEWNLERVKSLKKEELISRILSAIKGSNSGEKKQVKPSIAAARKSSLRTKTATGKTETTTKTRPSTRFQKERADESSYDIVTERERMKYRPESTQQQPPPAPEEIPHLPEYYGDTKVVLMIRDPYWAYVYWEINDELRQREGIERFNHDKKMLLRVYDVTDIQFNGSNAHSFYDIYINDYALSWFVNLPSPGRSYCVELAYIDNRGHFKVIARSNVSQAPRDTMSDVIDEEWMTLDDKYNELYYLSGGYRLSELTGSENISKLLGARMQEQLSSGAIPSSHQVPQKGQQKDFWLVVNTELIVYGATEPDATVKVQGREVHLRPDGTFSLRFALPDGKQVIPVEASNRDGDLHEQITPEVSKKTR